MNRERDGFKEFELRLREQFLTLMKMPEHSDNLKEMVNKVEKNNEHTKDMQTMIDVASKCTDKRESSIASTAVFLWSYESYYM